LDSPWLQFGVRDEQRSVRGRIQLVRSACQGSNPTAAICASHVPAVTAEAGHPLGRAATAAPRLIPDKITSNKEDRHAGGRTPTRRRTIFRVAYDLVVADY
jgi:putative intracellular protease/amidase